MKHLEEGCLPGIDFLMEQETTIDPATRSITYKYKDKMWKLNILVIPLYGKVIEEPSNLQKKCQELEIPPAIKHLIITETSVLINLPNRGAPQTLREIVKEQIEEMEKQNVIRENTRPYAVYTCRNGFQEKERNAIFILRR